MKNNNFQKTTNVSLFLMSMPFRFVLLLIMAFFLAIMLESQDRNTRLIGFLGLLIFSQMREILTMFATDADSKKHRK